MRKSLKPYLHIFALILFLFGGWVQAQDESPSKQHEFFTDLPSLLALKANFGWRPPSKGNWGPEIHVGFNLGTARLISGDWFHGIGAWTPFFEFFGPAVYLSSGMVRTKSLPGERARILRLLIAGKAYDTQAYNWSSANGECGRSAYRHFSIGPKITYGSQKWLSEHIGLEWQAGLGFRIGGSQSKRINFGQIDYSCSYYNFQSSLPNTDFGPWKISYVPTIHLGLAMTFR